MTTTEPNVPNDPQQGNPQQGTQETPAPQPQQPAPTVEPGQTPDDDQ